jgi:hypothetical protein
MLVVTVVAGQPICPIVKGQEVQEDVLRLLDPRQPQKSEDRYNIKRLLLKSTWHFHGSSIQCRLAKLYEMQAG